MRVAGRQFEIPDTFYGRTEADEWVDTLLLDVVAGISTWEQARTLATGILRPLGSGEGFIDSAVEALGKRAGLRMDWELDLEDSTTADNPNLGML